MRALGFVVKDVHVGMGLLPEVGATLVATTDSIDEKKLKELIEKQAEKKLLVTALKGLMRRATSNGRSPTCRSKGFSST